jgi:putative transposase
LKPPNHKRVYRVMKVHGLLLDRHAGGVERRHDGRIAVDARCSNGFEIGCDNCLRPAAPQVSRPCPNHWK